MFFHMHRASPLPNGEKRKMFAAKLKPAIVDLITKRAGREGVSQAAFVEACVIKASPTVRFAIQPVEAKVPRNKTTLRK
jgi:hypothetical protein